MNQQNQKRSIPWMFIVLIALVCLFAWKMTSNAPGGNKNTVTDPIVQVGMMVVSAQESYACNTRELRAQVTVFQVMGAQDKLRALLDRKECMCMRVLPQQRFKIAELKDKLAQVSESGAASSTTLWIPVRDLAPLAR